MARIKIKDLPRDQKISKEQMKKVMGGNPGFFTGLISEPLPIAGTVAAAIAIPVAIHNANNSQPESP